MKRLATRTKVGMTGVTGRWSCETLDFMANSGGLTGFVFSGQNAPLFRVITGVAVMIPSGFTSTRQLWYHSTRRSAIPPGPHRGTEDRTGFAAVPQAGAREGEEQPFQVHQPRRDDRK